MNVTFWNLNDIAVQKKYLGKYWEQVKEPNMALEREIDQLDVDSVKNMTVLQFYDFLNNKYFVQKYSTLQYYSYIKANFERHHSYLELKELQNIHKELFTFDKNDIKRGLDIANSIYGLGPAGASGLLSILFPNYFGTVDQFAVKNLQTFNISQNSLIKDINPQNISIFDVKNVISIYRKKACDLDMLDPAEDWTPRKVDMVLWGMRENNSSNSCR